MTPSPVALLSARIVVGLVLVYEAALLWKLLAWRARDPKPGEARQLALHGVLLAVVFGIVAGGLARSGALAPGLSGAGMPWEQVTDDTPIFAAAQAGQRAYLNRCAPGHLPEGMGLPPAYPPLLGSVILRATKDVHAQVALWGSDALHGMAAHTHDPKRARMPAFAGAASNAELAAILTYERVAFSSDRRV